MKLITDRTQTDVLLGTEKGRYGVDDLNRVERAVAELCAIAKGLDASGISEIKTNWMHGGAFSSDEWPTQSQMARYLGNINNLCKTVDLAANLPRSMDNLTWDGANQIEAALLAVYDRAPKMVQVLQYSGEIFAGEENEL